MEWGEPGGVGQSPRSTRSHDIAEIGKATAKPLALINADDRGSGTRRWDENRLKPTPNWDDWDQVG